MSAMPMTIFDRLVRKAVPKERTVVLENGAFTDAVVHGYDSYARSNGIYVGTKLLGVAQEYDHYDNFEDRFASLMNAPFYRMAVLDESIPAGIEEGSHLLLDRNPFFCRQLMIAALGHIGYSPACPELREAMLHDLRPGIRSAAAEALGKIGDRRYTADLIRVMREGKDASHEAMTALGDMKDDSALPALREMFEEARCRFDMADMAQDGDLLWEQVNEICKLTEIMIRAGGETERFAENWARYEFRDWVRRPMKSGADYSTIGRRLRSDEA